MRRHNYSRRIGMPTIEGSAVDVLENARKLIERPESWVQGAMACDNEGNYTSVSSWSACGYCAAGAVTAAAIALAGGRLGCDGYNTDMTNELYLDSEELLMEVLMQDPDNRTYLTMFNDHDSTTHQKVIDLFDEVIELARRKHA